ncbi:guanylate kinase [Sphingobacterium sp. ML3W]|jgi:guanylate kinase|uniref:Guanylate kinase n=2 Tax=Sphingobacterium TaxID=28453 RepID=A0A420AM66_SPHD1|nr:MULTISPECIES: guanylate kinase [Sphingobacterium]MCS4227786.1 guanylate kinase [Sphingobacterium sp. BIGb0165]RKE45535.1 guanylate kinase [Sphingobacterium detergens]ULT28440.1 guanylate kinase [Sphingobacterium sp. E70]WFA78322.1 guanylate kinase [Sphingobacterium sp. ML3W]
MSGKLIIFSAPSGAGKTTIVRDLLSKHGDKIEFSISASTRDPRGQEVDGKDYYFMSKEEFLHKVAKQEFIEFEEVYSGTFYGTLRSEIERIWKEGKNVIFDIDVVGGLRLKSKFPEQAISIFVQPPSLEVLKERLTGRGTDSEEKLQERFAKAELELTYANKFDVILKNFDLATACADAEEIVMGFINK